MKNILILLMLPFLVSADANKTVKKTEHTFKSLLESKKSQCQASVYLLLLEQLEVYAQGKSPKIADSCIKEIPIKECGEPLVSCIEQNDPGIISHLVHRKKPVKKITSCAPKMRKSLFVALQVMLKKIDELAESFGYKKGQIAIIAHEALRDVKTQEHYFTTKQADIASKNPKMTADEVYAETSKWLSPVKDNVPVHSTGAAIDIVLWDVKNDRALNLGAFGVLYRANKRAPTFSEDITHDQKQNRLLLLIAAAQAGLVNYSYEWWHFSLGDRYAAFWLEKKPHKRGARYGSAA